MHVYIDVDVRWSNFPESLSTFQAYFRYHKILYILQAPRYLITKR